MSSRNRKLKKPLSNGQASEAKEKGFICHLLLGPSLSEQEQAEALLAGNHIRYVAFPDNYVAMPVLIAGNRRYRGVSEIECYVSAVQRSKELVE